ncbi:MAG: dihydrodipicolinate synthase family protein [Planctomycetota bacterium]
MAQRLHGVLPIVQTPFLPDESIDFEALRNSVAWAAGLGARGVGTGMVSETIRLTIPERAGVIRAMIAGMAGRGPVFASVGAESSRQAVEHALAAEAEGCDAVMATPPMTSRLPATALRDYFSRIAKAISIPVIIQDASGYVGQPIPVATQVELFREFGPEKVLFKPEANPTGPLLSELRDATAGKASIFEGSGGIHLVDSHKRGVAGTMPGMDLLDGIVALWNALGRGNADLADRLHHPIAAIVAIQLQAGLDGFLAIEKHLLARRGLFGSNRRREPYGWTPDPETLAEVDRLFASLQSLLASLPRVPA